MSSPPLLPKIILLCVGVHAQVEPTVRVDGEARVVPGSHEAGSDLRTCDAVQVAPQDSSSRNLFCARFGFCFPHRLPPVHFQCTLTRARRATAACTTSAIRGTVSVASTVRAEVQAVVRERPRQQARQGCHIAPAPKGLRPWQPLTSHSSATGCEPEPRKRGEQPRQQRRRACHHRPALRDALRS